MEDREVTFYWRDYGDGNKNKRMSLEAFLVYSAVSITYFTEQLCQNPTLWATQQSESKNQAQAMSEDFGGTSNQEQQSTESIGWERLLFELTGIDPRLCPCCKKGRMVTREILPRQGHAPPRKVSWVA